MKILYLLPNGNWQDLEEVQFYLEDTSCVEEDQFLDEASETVADTFLDVAFLVWILSKWKGAEQSACEHTLFESCHGLESRQGP